MKRLDEIFEIRYGNQFDLSKMEVSDNDTGINFISRSSQNNGFVAKVLKYRNIEPFEAGLITVTMGGSYLLSSFVQPAPFYTAQNIKVLIPRNEMTVLEKLFYCYLIEFNRFRYSSHSREANSRFDDILVPAINEFPDFVNTISLNDYQFEERPIVNKELKLNTDNWKYFNLYDNFFDMYVGKYYPKDSFTNGKVPLISSSKVDNGVMEFTNLEPAFNSNCLTIGKVGMTNFYQPLPFCATADVTVLVPKFEMSVYCALFLKVILDTEKYRWTYGNQIRLNDCQKIKIKLPATKEGYPDWQFMENYIKSLPYSKAI